MIQEYKTSCSVCPRNNRPLVSYMLAYCYQGYLRTGQILQLLHKNDIAAGIYEYGLRSVSASDPNREVLHLETEFILKR